MLGDCAGKINLPISLFTANYALMQQWRTQQRDFETKWSQLLESASSTDARVEKTVAAIVASVRRKGDAALFRYTNQFDRCTLDASSVRISKRDITKALRQVPNRHLTLLRRAAGRIRRYHRQQKTTNWSLNQSGARMGLRWTPLERVGLYVPGGKAAYPSTVLMNAIPAQLAGVPRLVMVTPTPDGTVNPYTIAAAKVVGINEIYRVGGAQAVAALAYGTESISAVDKIVGPGNAYVATAKRQVFGKVDIDMIAGPTEVLVLADGTADPDFIAADLLSQAEHDPNARPVLITTSRDLLTSAKAALRRQLKKTTRRGIATRALTKNGVAILARNRKEAIRLANEMAPEHLLLIVRNKGPWMRDIRNAGAIFIGPYSPVAAGDYLVGPNHVLPTARTARYASPLGVYDFVKASSWLELSRKGLAQVSKDIVQLAELEGLTAHGDSVRIRLDE